MSLKDREYKNWFWNLGGMTFLLISRKFPQKFNLPLHYIHVMYIPTGGWIITHSHRKCYNQTLICLCPVTCAKLNVVIKHLYSLFHEFFFPLFLVVFINLKILINKVTMHCVDYMYGITSLPEYVLVKSQL